MKSENIDVVEKWMQIQILRRKLFVFPCCITLLITVTWNLFVGHALRVKSGIFFENNFRNFPFYYFCAWIWTNNWRIIEIKRYPSISVSEPHKQYMYLFSSLLNSTLHNNIFPCICMCMYIENHFIFHFSSIFHSFFQQNESNCGHT